MTTITRERLEQIYAECEERDPAIFEVRELVRIALASLDAEIVRYLNKFSGTCVTLEQQPNAADDVAVYIPLYTAPPAQIVSIPDDWQTCEKLSDDNCVDNALRELVEDTTGDNGVRVVQAVIRALRDSGLIRTYPDLSQPVDHQISEYEKIMGQAGNSPVIPDGYALVPVEPTDEMIAAAMECDDVVFDSKDPTAFCVQYREIYCAMVDVAPQPEGNNE